ncbi:hypothetical protein FJT64_011897 [Amphibalanus amphitrite]|uniref:Uncharacterized protein n=2 Tax=Amphibalanus amphitrite TaxID=1232801 RepID=A0A6A4VKI8_AMPAM|nr:hypothetical protein FJT64_011897 [Amphibalanus amphitrite]
MAIAGDPSSLQYLLKERQGAFLQRPPPRREGDSHYPFEDVYQQDHQWSSYSPTGRDGDHDEEFLDDNTVLQPPLNAHYARESHVTNEANHERDNPVKSLSFTGSGSHVARHPFFEKPEITDDVSFSSPHAYHESNDFASTSPPTPIKKQFPLSDFSPLLGPVSPSLISSIPSPVSSKVVKHDRDDFVHHSNSYSDDPTSYHVSSGYHAPTTYHTPATYQEPSSYEEDGSLVGNLKKYGGAMAPLLLATGLMFLFPSVQTITSSSRRRRRDVGDITAEEEDPSERLLLLVERLRTIHSSFADSPCPSRMFCQLGDVIADTSDPERATK